MNIVTKNGAFDVTVAEMVCWLVAKGLPPLPVAPAQDANKYPAKDKKGNIIRDENGNPKPAFTGKNPSYLDKNGKPRMLCHKTYQNRMPTQEERDLWFENPQNGVGVLGREGFRNLDIDRKHFDSQEACNQYFWQLLERKPELQDGLLAQSQGGGYRIFFECEKEPAFTNFCGEPGGIQLGELLGPGKFTVLPPTIGPDGGSYTLLSPLPDELPIVDVDFIYPYSGAKSSKNKPSVQPSLLDKPVLAPSSQAGAVDLALCIREEDQRTLAGNDIKGDRSDSLATLINELYGWENWLSRNGVAYSGNTADLAREAGLMMGLDEDRIGRILAGKSREGWEPAAYHKGGDLPCWRRVNTLSPGSVPKDVAKEIKKRRQAPPKKAAIPPSAKIPDDLPDWNQPDITSYLADKYRDKLAWKTDTRKWMKFNGSTWEPEPIEVIKNLIISEFKVIREYLQKQNEWLDEQGYKTKKIGEYTASFVGSILDLLAAELHTKVWDNSSSLIPFKNGCLDRTTGKLEPHHPSHKLTWCLPYDYNPLATCPQIMKWFHQQVESEDQIQLLRAYLKAIVISATYVQKFVELVGKGGTGKGTFTRLAIALVGMRNCFTTTLDRLQNGRFETAGLAGKKLVLINDSERYGGSTETLKAITGGDTLPYEEKHSQQGGLTFKPNCMVLLAANETIQYSDTNSGIGRRRITVPFNKQIAERDRLTLIEFTDSEPIGEFVPELPGLMNWVLAMTDEEMRRYLVNTSESVPSLEATKWQTLVESSNLASWVDDRLVIDHGYRMQVGIARLDCQDRYLYANYVAYCQDTNSKPISMRRFSAQLIDLLEAQTKITDVSKGKDRNGAYFIGLRIRQQSLDDHLPRPITERYLSHRGGVTGNVTGCDGYVTAETLTGDECDGCDGSFNVLHEEKHTTRNGDTPTPVGSSSRKKNNSDEIISAKNPSHPSQPCTERVSSITHPSPIHHQSITGIHPATIPWDDLVSRNDAQIERLGFSPEDAKRLLKERYGVKSRLQLTDDQVLDWVYYCDELLSKKLVGESDEVA